MSADWRNWPLEAKARARWLLATHDRPNQRTPPGEWYVWLILAGRGWGKTRTGAEDLAAFGLATPKRRLAVVAPTYADARDTCVEGESGLLSVIPPPLVRDWNRSLGELILTNETRFKLFSADEPDRLRGPQHHRAWGDELASWKYPDAFDQLLFGLRLGTKPRVVMTTTPKPTALLRDLLARPDVIVTRGAMFENEANLAPAAVAQLRARYEGTRLGRQELYGEVLDDVEGALWHRVQIDVLRVTSAPALERIVVAIDPTGTSTDSSDEVGILVAGKGTDGHGYVLADYSGRYSPDAWARRAIKAYRDHNADLIVAETNYGGDMVEHTLRTVEPTIPYTKLTASRGKHVRAEPIAALDEQGRVHHVGPFPELEDQMCAMTANGYEGDGSPDRLDARVWALTELFEDGRTEFF